MAAVFEVSNTRGAEFLENVYERALLRELALRGIPATVQTSFGVTYKGYPNRFQPRVMPSSFKLLA
jgi:GxxExxY protein